MTETNYAVPPGAYLEEWIEEQLLSRAQAADLLGWHQEQLDNIVDGVVPVGAATAMQLEQVVGIPVSSWLRYEAAYRADIARIELQE